MEKRKLSHALIDAGFFSALGTTENGAYVGYGTPNTWATSAGVVAIYDENGRPWIILECKMSNAMLDLLHSNKLRNGAHVPHTNDGGQFVQEVLVKLAGRRPTAKPKVKV